MRFRLAIDPGNDTGWAIFGDTGELCSCYAGEPPLLPYSEAVCECPRVYPKSPVPPNDLITLAVMVGRYTERHMCRLIYPYEWKGQLDKAKTKARVLDILSEVERKRIPKLSKTQMHNVYDAIGIGLYAFRGIKI